MVYSAQTGQMRDTAAQDKQVAADLIDYFHILDTALELARNGGSCGGISLKRDKCDLHLKIPHT